MVTVVVYHGSYVIVGLVLVPAILQVGAFRKLEANGRQ